MNLSHQFNDFGPFENEYKFKFIIDHVLLSKSSNADIDRLLYNIHNYFFHDKLGISTFEKFPSNMREVKSMLSKVVCLKSQNEDYPYYSIKDWLSRIFNDEKTSKHLNFEYISTPRIGEFYWLISIWEE